MSQLLWNLQWLNHNSQRSYPLTERAIKVDTTNTIRIPDSFIVSLYFPVHAGLAVATERFFIKTLLLSPIGYTIGIGYESDTETVLVGSVTISAATHITNRTYAVGGVDDFADTIGQIVIGKLDEINTLPPGLYSFDRTSGELETDAIRPMIRGIAGIRVINGVETSELIYGDVELVAGSNMRIDVSGGGPGPIITFNAISGLNLNEACVCADGATGECIRCINGVCSDDGSFTLTGGECIQVNSTSTGLSIEDTCAKPCCGCEELDALRGQIDRFSDGATTLQNFVSRLSAEVTQMSLTVIGSRLGDSDCTTCE